MKGLVGTLFVSALLLGAITAGPAAADPAAPLQLGLGDSWAAGFGDNPGEGGYVTDLHEALQQDYNCPAASAQGSAPRWSDRAPASGCPRLGLLNLAQGGATTPSMIQNQFPQALPLLQSRNGNRDPRDDVEVTTLHIGGNDVTNPIIGACLFGLAPCAATIQAELGAYRVDLDNALSALREAAGRKARIVIGTYDNPIATCFLAQLFPGEAVPLADLVLEGGTFVLRGQTLVVPQGLHDIMRDVGADYGVEVAEVYGDLSVGDWLGGNDCLHPDDSGYDKVAVAFEQVLGVDQAG
jgi:lysophospholipase L1-like esterase